LEGWSLRTVIATMDTTKKLTRAQRKTRLREVAKAEFPNATMFDDITGPAIGKEGKFKLYVYELDANQVDGRHCVGKVLEE
jgi:hypothetical protein